MSYFRSGRRNFSTQTSHAGWVGVREGKRTLCGHHGSRGKTSLGYHSTLVLSSKIAAVRGYKMSWREASEICGGKFEARTALVRGGRRFHGGGWRSSLLRANRRNCGRKQFKNGRLAEEERTGGSPVPRQPKSAGEGLPNSRWSSNYQFSRTAACNWRGVLKISLLDVSLPKVELCKDVDPVPNRTRLKMLNPSMRKSRFTFSVSLIFRFKERFSLRMGN